MNPCRCDRPRFPKLGSGTAFPTRREVRGWSTRACQTDRSGGSAAEAIRDAERSSFSTLITLVGKHPDESPTRPLAWVGAEQYRKHERTGAAFPGANVFFFFRTRGCAKCKRFVPFLHAAEILPVAFRLFNLRFFKQNKTAKHKRQRFRVQADKKKKKQWNGLLRRRVTL